MFYKFYHTWCPPLLTFKESKNSFLARLLFSLNTPDALVVTILAPLCFTPLQLTQLCVATTVTITPLLPSVILDVALWIADVNCSCIAPLRPNSSTILFN